MWNMSVSVLMLPVDRWQEYKKLRLAALSEQPKIAFQNDYQEEASWSDDVWRQRLIDSLAGKNNYVLFAQSDNRLCGMVTGVIEDGVNAQHRVLIRSAYVIPEYQKNLQVYTALITELLEVCDKNNKKVMYVTVNVASKTQLEFYEGIGFSKVGVLKKYVKLNDNTYQDRYLLARVRD